MDVLGLIKKKLQPYYKEYCLPKEENIGLEGFITFARHFGIFPQLISRVKLTQLFNNLAALYPLLKKKKEDNSPVSSKKPEETRKGIIDEKLFIEALAMCAVEIDESTDKHTVDKV